VASAAQMAEENPGELVAALTEFVSDSSQNE
jgi:hypothetical protein